MNKDDQTDKNKSDENPVQPEQSDDLELRIKLLERKRDALKKEQMKKKMQELEKEVDSLSQTSSDQAKPQVSSTIQGAIDCQVRIEQGIKNLTRDIDRKNDCKLQISPYANWGKLLIPAPMAISLLGDLYHISAQVDFNLKSQMPVNGFKYLKYPDSFRACLVQISNSGWRAFNEAHTCMDQIRLMSGSVDTHVMEAINIILDGTALEVEKCLPNILQTIDNIANESLHLAQNIEDNFSLVMDQTGELYEVSTSEEAVYGEKVRQLKAEQTDTKLSLEHEESLKTDHVKRLKTMEKRIERAQKSFEDAVGNQPGALSILGISLAEGLVDAVRNITSLPTEIVRGLGLGTYGIFGQLIQRAKDKNPDDAQSLEHRAAEFYLMSYVPFIEKSLDNLQSIIGANESVESKDKIDVIKSLFLRFRKLSSEEDCGQLSADIIWVCKTGGEICTNLENSLSSITTTDTEIMSNDQEKCIKLKQKIRNLLTKYKKENGRNPIDECSPCLPQRPVQPSSNALATVIEDARYKIQFAKESLEDIQTKHDLAEQQVEKNAKMIFEAQKKMKRLNLEDVDFKQIRTTLQEGIAALGEVRAQWANLVRFFSEISNLIKCCMNTSLKKFVQTVSTRAELQAAGDIMSNAFRANMYDQTLQASRISFVVCDMATSYVDISSNHIMPGVNLLQQFIGLNSIRHKDKMEKTMKELHHVCEEAQTVIISTIKGQHQELEKQAKKRLQIIQQELDVLIPSTEHERSIEDAVHKTFSIDN